MKHSTGINRLLKDVIGVKHISKPITSSILHVPETVSQNSIANVEAVVVLIGEKFRFKDDVKIGSIVLVPNHFGTRMENDLIIYDGEDILAIVEG